MKIRTLTFFALIILFLPMAKASCTFSQELKVKEIPVGMVLTWATSFESNNNTFIVEKSNDGKRFMTAGTVKGAGNSTINKNYNFLDAQATVGTTHYRLKQIDTDGTFSYTPVAIFNRTTVNDVQILSFTKGNPKKSFDVSFDIINSGTVTYQILDANNQIVIEQLKEVFAGINNLSIELSGLKEGVYKFNLKTENKEQETLTFRRSLDEFENKPQVASTRKAK
jgi:hypothetical protein